MKEFGLQFTERKIQKAVDLDRDLLATGKHNIVILAV